MDKLVLVTGASRGIGYGILRQCLDAGYNVIATTTSEKGKNKLDTVINEYNGRGCVLVGNLSDADTIDAWMQVIMEKYGHLPDVLVSNAGITDDQIMLRMKYEQWKSVIDVNLSANFLLTQSVIKHMMKKRWGRLIYIGSVSAHGNAGQVNYSASKAGLCGLARSVAKEYGPRQITANVVAPGFIQTDMTGKLNEEQVQQIKDTIPLQKLGHVDDVASLVLYLMSDAANYITGQTININGGMLTS